MQPQTLLTKPTFLINTKIRIITSLAIVLHHAKHNTSPKPHLLSAALKDHAECPGRAALQDHVGLPAHAALQGPAVNEALRALSAHAANKAPAANAGLQALAVNADPEALAANAERLDSAALWDAKGTLVRADLVAHAVNLALPELPVCKDSPAQLAQLVQ